MLYRLRGTVTMTRNGFSVPAIDSRSMTSAKPSLLNQFRGRRATWRDLGYRKKYPNAGFENVAHAAAVRCFLRKSTGARTPKPRARREPRDESGLTWLQRTATPR